MSLVISQILVLVICDRIDAEGNQSAGHHEKVYCLYKHEYDKVAMTAPPNAVVEPLTMVIKPINADVADVAMTAAR